MQTNLVRCINFVIFALISPLAEVPLAGEIIHGAGATFPYPLYSKWFSEYRKLDPETEINYQSIGSGGGIRQLIDQTVDFGASDAPMKDEQLKKAARTIYHFPMVLGAVAITYHLREAGEPLKLTPDVLAGIFLGQIKKWDDSRIGAINRGVKLPKDLDILVIYRSDGSGTTAVFSDYLSKVSPIWLQQVGSGTALKWPTGLGAKGNEGVTGVVKRMVGAISYVELGFALSQKLPVALLENSEKEFVPPLLQNVTATARALMNKMPDDFRTSLTNAPGHKSYPITGMTHLLMPEVLPLEKGRKLKAFLQWALTSGQAYAEGLHYAPLPPELANRVQRQISRLQLKAGGRQ